MLKFNFVRHRCAADRSWVALSSARDLTAPWARFFFSIASM
jgi:hypothetical protein